MTKNNKPIRIRFPIWSDVTFKEVFSNEKVTKAFLESLLGIKIRDLVFLNAEQEIRPSPDGRKDHLDILAIDENGVVYNIEMQGSHLEVIPYRYRTTGSGLDAKLIPKGTKTNELKKIPRRYVIFICREDPFGQDLRKYTIFNTIQQTGKRVDDKTALICLNASGIKGNVPVDIKAFLDYVKSGIDDERNAFVHMIHQKVVELNSDKNFVRYGMTVEQKIADGHAYGKEEGLEEGLDKGIQGTVAILRKLGRTDEEIVGDIAEQYKLSAEQAKEYV